MSLRHALLAILTAEPMTGHDLVKYFDGTVTFLWSAPHTQIYPELRRMEQAELVAAETVPRGRHAKKRVYRITERGTQALQDWLGTLEPVQPQRDPHRLRSAFFEWSSYDMARRQLQEHLSHYRTFREEREQLLADMKAGRVPLLRHRLEWRAPNEHQAIIAFKKFAFEGEIARASAEIEWAEKGLALLNELERSGASVVGSSESSDATSEPSRGKASGRARSAPRYHFRATWALLSSGLSRTADLADPDGPVHFYPGVAYPASKTAVNMVTVQYAKAFPGIRITPSTPATPPPT